jgi:HPt (histidine-containing phosphotransfer) domain-containing protein
MSTSTLSNQSSNTSQVNQLTTSCYQADQQAKLMNLQAEVESLLEQLQKLQLRRLAVTSREEQAD